MRAWGKYFSTNTSQVQGFQMVLFIFFFRMDIFKKKKTCTKIKPLWGPSTLAYPPRYGVQFEAK
jgi:hypothetical protein